MKSKIELKRWKRFAAAGGVLLAVGGLTYLGLSGNNDAVSSKKEDSVRLENATAGAALGEGTSSSHSPASEKKQPEDARLGGVVILKPAGVVVGEPLPPAGLNPDADKGRVVKLDPVALRTWGDLKKGSQILLPTPTGEALQAVVNLVQMEDGWVRMGGRLTNGRGTFAINTNYDKVEGNILLIGEGIGYQIRMDGSDVVLVERRLGGIVCSSGVKGEALGMTRDVSAPGVGAAGAQVIPVINTRPGAKGVIYCKFSGESSTTTEWNGGETIVALPSVLSGDQITQVMLRAAEDFAPFDITLTTDVAVFNAAPKGLRMKAIITPTDTACPGFGGVAYLYSWSTRYSEVCWVVNQGVKTCADTIAHEVGHTLGLHHDGKASTKTTYFPGFGGGLSTPTSWGALMGAPFSVSLTQWSKGEYFDADNFEDDLAIISNSSNKFGYIAETLPAGASKSLPMNGGLFQVSGLLRRATSVDRYDFTTSGGNFSATARPISSLGSGDVKLVLTNDLGNTVLVADPSSATIASASIVLPKGGYHLAVSPAGSGDKPAGGYNPGYSAYGSVGGYLLSGKVEGGTALPAFGSPTLISCTVGVPMSTTILVSQGPPTDPITVSVVNSNLPPGITFDLATMKLSGTPTAETNGVTGKKTLTLSASNKVGSTGSVVFNVVVSPVSQPLPDALGSVAADIYTTPESPWRGVTKLKADGSSGVVAESGPVGNKGASVLRFTYTAPPPAAGPSSPWSVMTFYWKSSSEAGKDGVQCKVDGVLLRDMISGAPLFLSGTTDWRQQTVRLEGIGKRTIEFSYVKDATLSEGEDRVWVYGVKIGQPPVISEVTPRAVQLLQTGSRVFSLKATVTGADTVVWRKDNGVTVVDETVAGGHTVSGGTSSTLNVTNAVAKDSGLYWLEAKNGFGTVASRRSEVVVVAPPVFTQQPVAQTLSKVGDSLQLTATVVGAQPIYYQWKKDGVPFKWSMDPTFSIQKTTEADAGKYTVTAVNVFATVTSEAAAVSFAQPASGAAKK